MVMLVLVRHAAHDELGRTLSGRAALPINERGRRQAAGLANRLARAGAPAAVHSSPQLRAMQTAHIVADRFGLEVETMDALDEIDFGDWTGASFERLAGEGLWQGWNERRSVHAPPNGEAMSAATARAVDHCEALRGAGDATILCVSHGDIIRGTIAHYLGLDPDQIQRFDVAPASVSRLCLTGGESRVVTVNEVAA